MEGLRRLGQTTAIALTLETLRVFSPETANAAPPEQEISNSHELAAGNLKNITDKIKAEYEALSYAEFIKYGTPQEVCRQIIRSGTMFRDAFKLENGRFEGMSEPEAIDTICREAATWRRPIPTSEPETVITTDPEVPAEEPKKEEGTKDPVKPENKEATPPKGEEVEELPIQCDDAANTPAHTFLHQKLDGTFEIWVLDETGCKRLQVIDVLVRPQDCGAENQAPCDLEDFGPVCLDGLTEKEGKCVPETDGTVAADQTNEPQAEAVNGEGIIINNNINNIAPVNQQSDKQDEPPKETKAPAGDEPECKNGDGDGDTDASGNIKDLIIVGGVGFAIGLGAVAAFRSRGGTTINNNVNPNVSATSSADGTSSKTDEDTSTPKEEEAGESNS